MIVRNWLCHIVWHVSILLMFWFGFFNAQLSSTYEQLFLNLTYSIWKRSSISYLSSGLNWISSVGVTKCGSLFASPGGWVGRCVCGCMCEQVLPPSPTRPAHPSDPRPTLVLLLCIFCADAFASAAGRTGGGSVTKALVFRFTEEIRLSKSIILHLYY